MKTHTRDGETYEEAPTTDAPVKAGYSIGWNVDGEIHILSPDASEKEARSLIKRMDKDYPKDAPHRVYEVLVRECK